MTWTRFMDMCSGGGNKEGVDYIFIEAPVDEARVIFYNRFGHSPDRVSCTCCGEDYSYDDHGTLEEATAYDRGCLYDREQGKYVEQSAGKSYRSYQTVEEYLAGSGSLFVRADEIKPEERIGDVPAQGYVWA